MINKFVKRLKSENYYITLLVDHFIPQLQKHINKKSSDYETLNTLLDTYLTEEDEDILRNIIKKYFDVKVSITRVSVPQCWYGIVVMVVSDYNTLTDLSEKLEISKSEISKIDFDLGDDFDEHCF